MIRNIWNMDPRGRRNGHRGFRPEIFLGIMGLFCFGWIIIAVIGGLLGAGFMVIGAVLHGLARVLPRLLTRAVTSQSVLAGLILGLVWYFRTHRRNTAAKEETESKGGATVDSVPVETEIVEAPVYRTFGS